MGDFTLSSSLISSHIIGEEHRWTDTRLLANEWALCEAAIERYILARLSEALDKDVLARHDVYVGAVWLDRVGVGGDVHVRVHANVAEVAKQVRSALEQNGVRCDAVESKTPQLPSTSSTETIGVVFGECLAERVPCAGVDPLLPGEIDLTERVSELEEFGLAGLKAVLGNARLVIVPGSVCVHVRGAAERTASIVEWLFHRRSQLAANVVFVGTEVLGTRVLADVAFTAHNFAGTQRLPSRSVAQVGVGEWTLTRWRGFAYLVLTFGDGEISGASGKAMASTARHAVRTLLGKDIVWSLFTSESHPFVENIARHSIYSFVRHYGNELNLDHHDNVAFSDAPKSVQDQVFARKETTPDVSYAAIRPTGEIRAFWIAAAPHEQLEEAWPILHQVRACAPKADLPPIDNPIKQISVGRPEDSDEDCIVLVVPPESEIDEEFLVRTVSTRMKCAVVDVSGTTISLSCVQQLLAIKHVCLIGVVDCKNLTIADIDALNADSRIVHVADIDYLDVFQDVDAPCYEAHRRFHTYMALMKISKRTATSHRLAVDPETWPAPTAADALSDALDLLKECGVDLLSPKMAPNEAQQVV